MLIGVTVDKKVIFASKFTQNACSQVEQDVVVLFQGKG
jgi:hypothetical protein